MRIDIFTRLLVALLLVALLPLTAFWQFERQRMIDHGSTEAQQRLHLFSDRVIQQVDDWSRLNISVMQLAASQADMRSMRPQLQRAAIASLMPQLPWAYLIHTADLTGLNVARSDDAPPADYKDRGYLKEILAGKPFAIEMQIGRTSHRPACLMAVPIISGTGVLSGLLIEASTLDNVTEAVSSAQLGRTGYAFLMTSQGRLIANAREPLNRELKDYSRHPAFLAAQRSDGLYRYSVDGVERIAQVRHTDLGWIAVVQQDVAESLEAVHQANRNALLLLGLTAALVTAISAMVARGFARPIEQATRAATAISHGQLDVDVETDRMDEIGDLMRAMQGMRHTLQEFLGTQRRMAEAAAHGNFSERGDELAFQHSYRDMVRHLNRLTDTSDRGFAELALVLAAVARGDLTVSMNGEYEGTFAALRRDINATVQALALSIREIELHRSLLHATLDHLPQGISVVDMDLKMIAWNRRYEEIFHYPEGLLERGRPIVALMQHNAGVGLMGSEDPGGEILRRLGHLRNGAPYGSVRALPDGTMLEIRGNAVPGVGYVTSFSDITVYKHTERALRALTESLERRVQERTSDLEAAKADAERANRSKTRFVAAAVHDLMQPLDAARMFVSAARPHLTEKSGTDMLDGIDSALAAEDEILSSLLDISRLESGMFEVQDREFALSPLLETLAREFGILAHARGIELRAAKCRATVRSDETLLRRILQNFLSNALRYTLRGRILLGCRRVGESLRIEVWDTGPGIAKADRQRIFLEFQRLDATGDVKRGAGLGLAIVERIGKRLGHPIGLRSWPGTGSVFSVTVPRMAACANQRAPPPQSEEEEDEDLPLRGRRICCLDDDVLVRNGVRMLLHGWGCEVMLAANGAEAIGLAERSPPPDILLVDYRLPDGTGPDFVEQLHRRWKTVMPVIMISAERDAQLRESFRRRNWAFLAKPVRPSKLRAMITQMLLRAEFASL